MSVKPRVNLILDCLILIAFLLTIFSGLRLEDALNTSYAVGGAHRLHALIAYLFVGLIVTHQLFHWKWITAQIRQLIHGSRRQAQVQER